ncbi:hypothetical protein Nepgr_032262 [Nepenthes gracilis]|uniref:Uncharacterized protein n=1 Tax=Nepenthes gracilis TaxID=150966 RepID=A0AAD3Y7R4_NEPGR|nr:hypothetical protein Nepgr_032262 [Nepenthes gracilis]
MISSGDIEFALTTSPKFKFRPAFFSLASGGVASHGRSFVGGRSPSCPRLPFPSPTLNSWHSGPSLDSSLTASEATGGAGCSLVLDCQVGAPPNLAGSPAGRPNQCMPEAGSVDPQLFPPVEVVHCSPVGVSSELHQLHGTSGPCLVDGSRIPSEPGSRAPTWASVVEKKAFGGGPGFVDRLPDLPMVHVDIVHSDVSSHDAAALFGMESDCSVEGHILTVPGLGECGADLEEQSASDSIQQSAVPMPVAGDADESGVVVSTPNLSVEIDPGITPDSISRIARKYGLKSNFAGRASPRLFDHLDENHPIVSSGGFVAVVPNHPIFEAESDWCIAADAVMTFMRANALLSDVRAVDWR